MLIQTNAFIMLVGAANNLRLGISNSSRERAVIMVGWLLSLVLILSLIINIYAIREIVFSLNSRIRFRNTLNGLIRFRDDPFVWRTRPKVLVVGDSLAGGAGASWRSSFSEKLKKILPVNVTVLAEGGSSSSRIKDLVVTHAARSLYDFVVIWAGRNNYEDAELVVRDINVILEHLNPKISFVVLGVISGDYCEEEMNAPKGEQINLLNRLLRDAFGEKFIPVHEVLISYGRRESQEDNADMEMGVIPVSLRSDRIHLNTKGYTIAAIEVSRAILRRI